MRNCKLDKGGRMTLRRGEGRVGSLVLILSMHVLEASLDTESVLEVGGGGGGKLVLVP